MADTVKCNTNGWLTTCDICGADIHYYSRNIRAKRFRNSDGMIIRTEKFIMCPNCENNIPIGDCPIEAPPEEKDSTFIENIAILMYLFMRALPYIIGIAVILVIFLAISYLTGNIL